MPDLPTVTVTGLPIFGNPFDQDAPPEFIGGGLSLNEAASASEAQYPGAPTAPDEAFAPPVVPLPVPLLPEVLVEPAVAVGRGVLTGLTALLFPISTGPALYDEAPGGVGAPPRLPPEGAEDPIMPPNWEDIANAPFNPQIGTIPRLPWGQLVRWLAERLSGGNNTPAASPPVPILDEFVVSPPGVDTRSGGGPLVTLDSYLIPGSAYDYPGDQVTFQPLPEVPLVEPGIKLLPADLPDIGPGPAPAPRGTPGIDPLPGFADPFATPGPSANPRTASEPTPDVLGDPFADPIGNPIGDPIASPPLPTGTGPGTRTTGGTGPSGFADVGPTRDPLAQIDPLEMFGPGPVRPEKDTCQCDKKPKERKKRKPREKCFKGTYIQRASGTIFRPTEEVPCDAPLPKKVSKRETDPFGRPVPKKRKSKRTPTWQDTINDVFYPQP